MEKKFLNSPEWTELSRKFQEAREEHSKLMQEWWTNLPSEQQQWAFYNVCRLIYKGDVVERRSYRGVLYGVFGWGPEAYAIGMEANYMDIHNLLWEAVNNSEAYPSWELDRINQELEDAAKYDNGESGVG